MLKKKNKKGPHCCTYMIKENTNNKKIWTSLPFSNENSPNNSCCEKRRLKSNCEKTRYHNKKNKCEQKNTSNEKKCVVTFM